MKIGTDPENSMLVHSYVYWMKLYTQCLLNSQAFTLSTATVKCCRSEVKVMIIIAEQRN